MPSSLCYTRQGDNKMARMNFEELERLSTQTTEQISKSSDNWLEFVKSASNLYRYPFRDQLLIYAQRPDA